MNFSEFLTESEETSFSSPAMELDEQPWGINLHSGTFCGSRCINACMLECTCPSSDTLLESEEALLDSCLRLIDEMCYETVRI